MPTCAVFWLTDTLLRDAECGKVALIVGALGEETLQGAVDGRIGDAALEGEIVLCLGHAARCVATVGL